MGKTRQIFALVLILTMASQVFVLTVKPASAQTIPTPSVPTFTVQPVGPPIIVNTTYSLDPNTGQIVPNLGYTNQYSGIKIIIKNQAFKPYNDSSGNLVTLYYNVRLKIHNETAWVTLYDPDAGDAPVSISPTSDYTNVSYNMNSGPGSPIPVGTTQIDIQVDAYIGYIQKEPANNIYGFAWGFIGQKSNWSDTQTITLPANVPLSLTPTQSPTTTAPTQMPTSTAASGSPSTSFWQITSTISLIVIAFLLAIIVALLLYVRKRNRLISLDKT